MNKVDKCRSKLVPLIKINSVLRLYPSIPLVRTKYDILDASHKEDKTKDTSYNFMWLEGFSESKKSGLSFLIVLDDNPLDELTWEVEIIVDSYFVGVASSKFYLLTTAIF